MKDFFKKYDIWFLVVLLCLIVSLVSNFFSVRDYKRTISRQSDSLASNQVLHRVLQKRMDTLVANNARLTIELFLNDCNQYKIHEKISAIPTDSLLLYADSLLSKPINPAARTKKNGGVGATIKKLLGIQRTVLGPKNESCGGDCG